MKKTIEILLALNWNSCNSETIRKETESLLKLLEESEFAGELPVHWIIPPSPFLEIEDPQITTLLEKIKKRITCGTDRIFSPGYSMGITSLMTPEERSKEIHWSLSNPWKSGLKDYFETDPEVYYTPFLEPPLFSREPDPLTQNFSYGAYKTRLQHPAKKNNALKYFSLLPLRKFKDVRAIKKQIKNNIKQKCHFLFFEIDFAQNINTIEETWKKFYKTLLWIKKKYILALPVIKDSRNLKELPVPEMQNSLCHTPEIKNILLLRENKRAQNKKIRETLKTLNFLQLQKLKKEEEPPMFPPEDRLSAFSMQGNAVLQGKEFSASFDGGKFKGFILNNQEYPLFTRSYIKIKKKEYDFQNTYSFSTGGEATRGLRELSSIDLPEQIQEGRQLTDYFFIDDYSLLFVTSRIKYPAVNSKTDYTTVAPLEFTLFSLKKNETFRITSFRDEGQYEFTGNTTLTPFTVCGSMFVISKDDTHFTFGLPSANNQKLGLMECRIVPQKNTFLLKINIIGTYTTIKSSSYNNVTELFSFYTGITKEKPENFPFFPNEVLKEIPPAFVSR